MMLLAGRLEVLHGPDPYLTAVLAVGWGSWLSSICPLTSSWRPDWTSYGEFSENQNVILPDGDTTCLLLKALESLFGDYSNIDSILSSGGAFNTS